jgi:hypothetical protein
MSLVFRDTVAGTMVGLVAGAAIGALIRAVQPPLCHAGITSSHCAGSEPSLLGLVVVCALVSGLIGACSGAAWWWARGRLSR